MPEGVHVTDTIYGTLQKHAVDTCNNTSKAEHVDGVAGNEQQDVDVDLDLGVDAAGARCLRADEVVAQVNYLRVTTAMAEAERFWAGRGVFTAFGKTVVRHLEMAEQSKHGAGAGVAKLVANLYLDVAEEEENSREMCLAGEAWIAFSAARVQAPEAAGVEAITGMRGLVSLATSVDVAVSDGCALLTTAIAAATVNKKSARVRACVRAHVECRRALRRRRDLPPAA